MGLDAFVFCDCYEKGRLREPPPVGVVVRIEADGAWGGEFDGGNLESNLAWDEWREHRACLHKGGILLHHRLGTISEVGLLRAELQREAKQFPILVTRVVYSGSHSGDFLRVEEIPALQNELELLRAFRCSTKKADWFMARFREQLRELAAAALLIGKPIAF